MRPALGRGLTWAIIGAAGVGVAAVLYAVVGSSNKPGPPNYVPANLLHVYAKGSLAKLQSPPQPASYPPTSFVDGTGKPMHLSAFRGQVVVLNLWATWCAPCKTEMPTLAALQRAYAGKPLRVVAVSMDKAAQGEAAQAFIAAHAPLAFYQDANYGFLSDLKPHLDGFPTTVLFDRTGAERAILPGEADWASPEARALVDRLLSE